MTSSFMGRIGLIRYLAEPNSSPYGRHAGRAASAELRSCRTIDGSNQLEMELMDSF